MFDGNKFEFAWIWICSPVYLGAHILSEIASLDHQEVSKSKNFQGLRPRPPSQFQSRAFLAKIFGAAEKYFPGAGAESCKIRYGRNGRSGKLLCPGATFTPSGTQEQQGQPALMRSIVVHHTTDTTLLWHVLSRLTGLRRLKTFKTPKIPLLDISEDWIHNIFFNHSGGLQPW